MSYKIRENNAALETLDNISKSLNDSTTELNDIIKKVEDKLIDMRLGVSGWSDSTFEVETNRGVDKYRLGFCRIQDEWKLVAQRVNEKGEPDGKLTGLLYATRIVRIKACSLLEDLVNNLIDKTDKFLDDVTKTKESLYGSSIIKEMIG